MAHRASSTCTAGSVTSPWRSRARPDAWWEWRGRAPSSSAPAATPRNRIANAEFHRADLGTPPDPALPWMRESYTHVLLDPPRTGARAVLAAVAALAPRRVLYVSCQPGSLARDLSILVHEHGFELEKAGVVDMFPHTAHVESLALLVPGGRRTAAGRPAA